ncbi:MAG: hypothetical protein ABFD69_06385 [Candidatus Sumerlaeia bacterium]
MKRHLIANPRRGAVLIIVIALLGVLALMIVTLSYGTRVEYMASRNWGNSVQSRMAAVSELPLFQPTDGSSGAVTLMSAAEEVVASADGSRQLSAVPIQLRPASSLYKNSRSRTLADIAISDMSARLNINAVVPVVTNQAAATAVKAATTTQVPTGFIGETELARLISAVMERANISGPDPQTLAHAIAIHRYGKDGLPGAGGVDDNYNAATTIQPLGVPAAGILADRLDNDRDGKIDNKEECLERDGIDNDHDGVTDETGEGIDEPAECLSDPRVKPNGDDTPYASLTELMGIDGMTQQLYAALEPYLTTLSVSYAAFELPDQTGSANPAGWPQLDPNTAPPELIYGTLKKRFPAAGNDVIGQFVANLVDRRDRDSVPCKLELEDQTYRGQELTPCISEVCTSNLGTQLTQKTSRHGQFVEIANPYQSPLSVDGWVLVGAGPEIQLSGKLPAGGFYVITDDYNDQSDGNRGKIPDSFFANFGVVSSGPDQIIVEDVNLDLLGGSGHLELKDNKGNLIDEFDYDPQMRTGMTLSFQRNDPRLNYTTTASPTPLHANYGAKDNGMLSKEGKLALQTFEQTANQLIRNPLDAMLVGTAHVSVNEKSAKMSRQEFPFQLPQLSSGDSQQLDIRLVDCFLPGADVPLKAKKAAAASYVLSEKQTNETISDLPTESVAVLNGRVNLNTAPIGVLAALPGMTPALLVAIRDTRDTTGTVDRATQTLTTRDKTYWREFSLETTGCWANLSDFMADSRIWGSTSLYDRLNQAYAFAPLLGTHTMTLKSVATTRVASSTKDPSRRQNITRAERILAGDRGMVETVSFRFVGSAADAAGDPDQRSAMTLSSAKNRIIFQPSSLARSMGRRSTSSK